MSGYEQDPINFREVDSQGNPTGYGPGAGQPATQRSRLSVNPFIVALWVIEAILLVSPFGVFTLAQESLNSGTQSQVMPVSYMWITFAPQMLFAGLAGFLGLLFWHAAQWQRNRAKQPPPS
ncbi:hypothetical protein QF036_000704 [Arthrobacter globiformis]|nr:hypothetical protein [Arthrobacter globiformis]